MKPASRTEELAIWIRSSLPTRGVEIAWVGQAGFLIRSSEAFIGIDLYLSDSLAQKYKGARFEHIRMMEVPVEPSNLESLDVLLSTHAHTDHLDPLTIEELYRHGSPLFVGPRAEARKALDRGAILERSLFVSGFEEIREPGLSVEALPSAHEELEADRYGNDRALGYVLEVGGARIYHSGDCVPYDGLESLLKERDIDIALLPVNGRDAERTRNGIPGNFTAEEALALAETAGIPHLVVHHFGMFAFNTVDRKELEKLQRTHESMIIPSVGQIYHFLEEL